MNRQTASIKSSSYRNSNHGNWSAGESSARWGHDGWDEGGRQSAQMNKPPPHNMRRNSVDHWAHDDRNEERGTEHVGQRRVSPSPGVGSGERLRKGRGKRPDLQVYVPRGRRMYADDEPVRTVGNQTSYSQNATCPSPKIERRKSAPHTEVQHGRGYRAPDNGERVKKSPKPQRKSDLSSPEVNRRACVKKESNTMSDFLQSRMYSDVEPKGSTPEAHGMSGRRASGEETKNQHLPKTKKQRNSHDGESRRRRRSRSHDKRKSVSKERAAAKSEVPSVDIVLSPGPGHVRTGSLAGMDSRLLDVDTYDQLGIDDWDGDPVQPVSPAPGALPYGQHIDLTSGMHHEPYYCPKPEPTPPHPQPVAPTCPELATCAHGSVGDLSVPSPSPGGKLSTGDLIGSPDDGQQKLPLPAGAAVQQSAHLASQTVKNLSGVLMSAAEASYDQGTAVPASGSNRACDLALLGTQETFNMDTSEHQQKQETFYASHQASVTETELKFAEGSSSSSQKSSSGGSPSHFVTSTCIAIAPIDTVTCSSVTSVAHVMAVSTAEFSMTCCQLPDAAADYAVLENPGSEPSQITGNPCNPQSLAVADDSAITDMGDVAMDSCDRVTEELENEVRDVTGGPAESEGMESKHDQGEYGLGHGCDISAVESNDESSREKVSSKDDGCEDVMATGSGIKRDEEICMDSEVSVTREEANDSESVITLDSAQNTAESDELSHRQTSSGDIIMEESRTLDGAVENDSSSENIREQTSQGDKSTEVSCEKETGGSNVSEDEAVVSGDAASSAVSEEDAEPSGGGKRKVEAEEEPEEDSWEAMFDDDGEALDPTILDELTVAVGKVVVQKPQFDYYNYQTKDPELDDDTYGHVIEIYDFSSELVTRDLMVIFKDFQDRGFDMKWVDDTHAIGIFASAITANEALEMRHPMVKVRPLSQASRQTKVKAKRGCDFLEPYKPRPETNACVARNLVTKALGIKAQVPREKRDEERRKLREAKEKKRATARQKKEAWEGTIGRCAMDDDS